MNDNRGLELWGHLAAIFALEEVEGGGGAPVVVVGECAEGCVCTVCPTDILRGVYELCKVQFSKLCNSQLGNDAVHAVPESSSKCTVRVHYTHRTEHFRARPGKSKPLQTLLPGSQIVLCLFSNINV